MTDHDEPAYDDDFDEPRRSRLFHPISLALLAIALFSLSFFAFVFSSNQLDGEETTSDTAAPTTTEGDGATGADDGSGETSTTIGEPTTSAAGTDDDDGAATDGGPPDGAYVEATLNLDAGPGPGLFTLAGRVPDEETANALIQAAELSYAPFVESDLEVDESLDAAPWLATSPALIGLLPSVTDGTILIADGKVDLRARSPNPQYLALLEGALTVIGELPVEVSEATITDLVPPAFYVEVDGGQISLTGDVPSEAIRGMLEQGAAAAYGAENVSSELGIDEATYTSFWMYTMPGVFQLFSPFQAYQFQVVDGVSSGALQGGVNFEVNSTQISEQAAQVLNIGVSILARDRSIFMTVEGHTDSSGPEDYNQQLSEARAASVVAYFTAAGIGAERLLAVGAGETEPIAPNDTTEGKALNRRVEFEFGPPPS